MEMFQIRYVLAAARSLNFTKAAAECNVSQPALTKAIKNLEAELGTDLFHREGRRVRLSDFGRSMLPHLQHIFDETEATQPATGLITARSRSPSSSLLFRLTLVSSLTASSTPWCLFSKSARKRARRR